MRFSLILALVVGLVSVGAKPAMGHEQSSWADRLSFKGDLRLRYEGIDEEGEEDRERGRYRARLGMTAQATENIKVIAQLASGADDPVSRNVTFDGGFDVDDIGFDLFYVDWAFADGWNLFGGKMKNPLYRAGGAPLVWDSDLNPEGLALKYGKGAWFGTLASFSVEERASSSDSLLLAAQFGGKFALAENLKLTAGVGYIGYSNTAGNRPFYDGSSNGNSVDANGDYLHDYKSTEVFVQFDTSIGDMPLALYGQWVQNNEVDIEDTGYAVGTRLGIGKGSVSWTYQDVEADAVIGTFNDSDFGGGGTDASGHILKVGYPLAKAVTLGGTLFLNDVDRFQGDEHDYTRYQLDIIFSFK